MADNGFTFWANMKEAIDAHEGNPEYQYKLYDALTEYGLYGIWPEDDGTIESKNLIMFVQTMVPSVDKSSNFSKKCAESGSAGGRKQKVSNEQIEKAIIAATRLKNGVPSRAEVVMALKDLTGIVIDTKTVSRRCPDARKKEIAEETLGQNRDKINVPETLGQNVMSLGQNEDINNVPGTLGQNRDKINVPQGQNESSNVLSIFNF